MKKYQYQDFSKLSLPHSGQLSPDGKHLAFLARIPDDKTDSYLSKIYVTNVKTGKCKKLTNVGTEGGFTWLDNKTLLFTSLRNDADKKLKEKGELLTVFYKIAIDGGEAEEEFRLSLANAAPTKIARNLYVIRAYHNNAYPDLEGLKGKARDEALAAFKEEADYEVADEFPYRFDGMGYVNKKRSRLYLYHASSKKLTPITDPFFATGSMAVAENGGKIYYAGEEYTVETSNTAGIFCYDVASGKTETILPVGKYSVGSIGVTQDQVYFTGMIFAPIQIVGALDLWSVSLKSKKVEKAYSPEGDFGFSLVADAIRAEGYGMKVYNNTLYFLETRRYGCALYAFEQGKAVELTNPELQIGAFDMQNGVTIALGAEFNKPGEFYAIDGQNYRAISKLTDKFVKTFELSPTERLTFKNKDGIEIDGWVIKPIGYEKGKKYPGYLEVHGGPRANYSRELMLDLQFVASQGYFVFYCNPRGSGSRGNDFANINGKYGTVDYEDLMEFTDQVLKKYPDMDGKRLGVGGGSYGGFMSNWIIGQTNRFKASIPQCSISNWITMYGCSDIPKFCHAQMNGTPWDNYDGLWKASPLKYAPNVKTPTLFLQYGDDFRCPMGEAVQMYTALMFHGVETRMVVFPGNSHKMRSLGKPTHRNRRCKEILAWLNKYVKGE